MRSLRLRDSVLGLLISAALVAAACFVLVTLDRHAEEHGHYQPGAAAGVVGPQRLEGEAGSGRQGRGVGHGFFSPAGVSQRHSTELSADE